MNLMLWIDDERVPEPGWIWAKTSAEAIEILERGHAKGLQVDAISFDHDLGYQKADGTSALDELYQDDPTVDDTTRPVLHWMAEHDYWPRQARVHSANPVGVKWLLSALRHDGPEGMQVWAEAARG